MKPFSPILLLTAAMALAASSTAEEENACDGTTYDMSVCLSKILNTVDAELNFTYQKALKSATTTNDAARLRAAQKAWIAYREANCNAEYGLWDGGSGGPNARAACVIRMTRNRTREIKDAYLSQK